MTRIQNGKSVTRETAIHERGAAVVVRLHPRYLEVWVKGVHEKYPIDYETVLALAQKRAWVRQWGRR